MPTMSEKILAKASGKDDVEAGDIVIANIDVAMTHDLTGPLSVESFEKIGAEKVWDSSKIVIPFDHQVPADSIDSANNHIIMRDFVKKQGIENFYDVNAGVCHQILPELGHVVPGEVVVGADSHTCTHGALGAFSTGIGSTDMAMVFAEGNLWLKVPETNRFNITGTLKENVYAKDVILKEQRLFILCVDFHTAELVNIEWLSSQSDALLLVDGRSSVFQSDSDIAYQQQRREDDEAKNCYAEVEESFHRASSSFS